MAGPTIEKAKVPTPFIITFGGVQRIGWARNTYYIDIDSAQVHKGGSLGITTEGLSPFSIRLNTFKNIDPGTYNITIVYTYFNGQDWSGQQQTISFKVKNYVERNTTWLTIVGLIFALVAVIPLLGEGIKRIRSSLFWIFKRVVRLFS